MNYINQKIKEVFPDLSVMKRASNNALFKGRNLPSFVKDFVLRRYTDGEGNVNADALKQYLDEKMPIEAESVKQRLLNGGAVNITTRFVTITDIANARVKVTLPELGINADTYPSEECMTFFFGDRIKQNSNGGTFIIFLTVFRNVAVTAV